MTRRAVWVAIAALAIIPFTGQYAAVVGALAVIFGLIALGYVVLTGYAGDVSLGQVVPYGLGAYGTYYLSDRAGFPVVVAILVSALLVAPIAAVIAIPALRLRGLDLAIATFALALVFQLMVFRNLSTTFAKAPSSLTDFSSSVVRVARPSVAGVQLSSNRAFYAGALVLGAIAYAVVAALVRSGLGRSLRAVRDDAGRAAVIGVPVSRLRVGAFVVAGVLAALAGGLLASLRQAVTPDTFNVFDSLNFLAMAVVGGLASPVGAVLGGAFGAALPELARQAPFRFLEGRLVLVYGLALVVLLAVRPGGLASLLGFEERPSRPSRTRSTPAPAASERGHAAVTGRVRRALLRVEHVTVAFGGVRAVDDVTLRVGSGEAVALIGPNGAGKSTLIDVVSGLLPPTAGRVFFAGSEITAMAPHRRAAIGIGRTFQAARVFPTLSIRDNLAVATRLLPRGGDAEVAFLLERLDLARAADERPARLPFGSLRRLEVGVALAARPTLLLLDEPGAGMDEADLERLAALIDDVRREDGLALLLVEHDVALVGRLAERVIVLEQGRIVAEGTPATVAADAAVIASFLGTSAAVLAGGRSETRRELIRARR